MKMYPMTDVRHVTFDRQERGRIASRKALIKLLIGYFVVMTVVGMVVLSPFVI